MLYLTGFGLELDDLRHAAPVGLPHARSPRVPPHRRRRGHHRPARAGLRQRRRHRPRRGEPARAVRPRRLRPPRVRRVRRRLPRGGGEPRGRVARRAPRPRAARLRLRRQPHHHRRPDRARPTATTSRSASRATAGTSSTSARSRTTSTRIEAGIREGMAEADRPSVVILRSHIGYPSPKYTDTALRARQPARRRRGRGRPRRSSGSRRTSFFVPDDVLAYYREAGARGRAAREDVGATRRGVPRRARPSLAAEYDACLEQRGLAGWEAKLPVVGARREGRHAPRVAARCSARSPTSCPGCSPAAPTSPGTPARCSRAPR